MFHAPNLALSFFERAVLMDAGLDAAVWCRIDGTAHEADESARLDNLIGDAKVMALLASR